jgi:hypothetical protein
MRQMLAGLTILNSKQTLLVRTQRPNLIDPSSSNDPMGRLNTSRLKLDSATVESFPVVKSKQ